MAEALRAAITGVGTGVPEMVFTNFDFEKILDTSDEWISRRTGIRERRLVSDGESTSTLAIEAARNALSNAGITADQLDLIVCATVSPDMLFPAAACFVQEALGAKLSQHCQHAAACLGGHAGGCENGADLAGRPRLQESVHLGGVQIGALVFLFLYHQMFPPKLASRASAASSTVR